MPSISSSSNLANSFISSSSAFKPGQVLKISEQKIKLSLVFPLILNTINIYSINIYSIKIYSINLYSIYIFKLKISQSIYIQLYKY